MQIPKPTKMGVFQLLTACLLVAFFTNPGEAKHGPMLILKGGHGHGDGMGAASILAAGLVIKLLSEIGKHKHHHHSSHHHGHSMGGGFGMGNGMGHSFESHDAHLGHYGYEPQGYGWM